MLHQIGAGAVGPVFRAYEPELDRLVAVKLVQQDLAPDRVHRLVAEFERLIAADVTHPALAAPLATGIAGHSAFLAQDFVSADSIDVVVRDHGTPPAADAMRVVTQLAGVLDAGAAAGIFHGALHPRDLLVSPDEVRLTGLGVVQALERVGVPVPVRRPYTAPECVSGQPWDQRADVFALAAVAFELLWGRRVSAIGSGAVDGLTPIAGAAVDGLSRVFVRALAEDPGDRFESAGAFAEALRFALGGALKSARRASRGSGPRPVVGEVAPRLPLDPTDGLDLALASTSTIIDLSIAPPAPTLVLPSLSGAQDTIRASAPLAPIVRENPDPTPEPMLREPEPAPEPEHLSPPPVISEPVVGMPTTPLVSTPADTGILDPPPLVRRRPRSTPPATDRPQAPHGQSATSGATDVWPIALAVLIGVAIGFALGQVFPLRQVSGPVPTSVQALTATEAAVLPSEGPRDVPLPSEYRPPPPPAARETPSPPPVEGQITIRSTPPGASVTVNGRREGQTPATLRGLPAGTYVVRLARDGYTTQERRVVISRTQQTPTVAVTLARPAAPAATTTRGAATAGTARGAAAATGRGSLRVESRPAGARVLVNGKAVGTTPMDVADLPVGEHVVTLEHDGRTWTDRVTVTGGQRTRVAASLQP